MYSWMKWAASEGLIKTIGAIVAKWVGLALSSIAAILLFTFVEGVIQALSGAFGARYQKETLKPPSYRELITASFFGISAAALTALTIYTFMIGADLAVRTFIMTMSIIPGAFLDWGFFGHPLNRRQWFGGLPMFLLAGWAMLGFPALGAILVLPAWVWLTFIAMLLQALNEALSQATKKMNPYPNNFWVGTATAAACAVALITVTPGLGSLKPLIIGAPQALWVGAILGGIIVAVMIAVKLITYRKGGTIAFKKVIMQGNYLITAALAGILIFAEPLTIGKVVGTLGYFVAFALMDNTTWTFLSQKFFRTAPAL